MLYNCKNNKLTLLTEKPARREKDIQLLIERNLELIFCLKPVKSECTIENKKIDTLAYDPARKSLVIIEYKKEKTLSLFDQGMAYLKLMLDNKDALRSVLNDTCAGGGSYIKHADVNWKRTKIIFISPGYTSSQLHTADFWQSSPLGKEYLIELWEIKLFENGFMGISPVKKNANSETYVSSEERLTAHRSPRTQTLYSKFRKRIMSLDKSITVNPKKREIGFMLNDAKIADISVHRGYIKLWLNAKRGTLGDSRKLFRDVSKLRHWGSGDYEITLYDTKDINYVTRMAKKTIEQKR